MRTKRVEKFKRHRKAKMRNIIFFAIVLPSASIIVGYLITSLIILPAMAK